MIEGRSTAVFKQRLADRPEPWRAGVEVVALVPRKRKAPPGFSGFKTAAVEEVPAAVAVIRPFHVVRLAADVPAYFDRPHQQRPHRDD